MLIDTHCHLYDSKYDQDRAEVVSRAAGAGVQNIVCIACDLKTSLASQEVAAAFPSVFFAAGIHPHDSNAAEANYIAELRNIAADPKCVAIGECGLDFYYNHSEPEVQKRIFAEQIDLAAQLNKTLVVHARDAWDECLQLLAKATGLTVIIHCFSGPASFAQSCLERGYYLSFSGIVTFKKGAELLDIAAKMPLEQLLIETDAPYLTPEPFRGKRNEPELVALVAQKIALARGIPVEELANQTTKNAQKCFGLNAI